MDIRILIVDDSRAVIDTLSDMLSRRGYKIESRGNGEAGWARLIEAAEQKAAMPDLLLLDLNMPGIDGLELLRRVRADERFGILPVIILTVEADPDTRMEALTSGANDYLPKPIQAVELMAKVDALLGLKKAERRQLERMEHLVEAGRGLLSTLELQSVLQHVVEIAIAGMNTESTSIWLRAWDGGLECRAASGSAAKRLIGAHVDHGQGIVGWVFQHKQSVLVPDAKQDSRFYPRLDDQLRFETRDLVCVPLLVRGASIGVLQAVNRKDDPFSEPDLAWMEVMAPLAAAAIANAQLVQTLRKRTEELQASNEELDAFARTVAHDLKSPLARIVGFSETLEAELSGLSEQEVRQHLHTVAQGGRKMSRIVDELLLLAGVRKMNVSMVPLEMSSIVSEALQRLERTIQEQQVQVVLPKQWPAAMGHAPWIEEVWVNYISNAIKYGGRPPRVELGATPQSDGMVRFWVRDNGQGLSPEAQSRLFTPFTRLEQMRAEGHGLGLSIVRRIIEKLGGQAGVESSAGRGSAFSFTLMTVANNRSGSKTATPQASAASAH